MEYGKTLKHYLQQENISVEDFIKSQLPSEVIIYWKGFGVPDKTIDRYLETVEKSAIKKD